MAPGFGSGGTRQPGLHHRLRQPQITRNPEALVDTAPLLKEAAVASRVREQEVPARRVVQHGPGPLLQDLRDLVPAIRDPRGEREVREHAEERRVLEAGGGEPIASNREARQQVSVPRASVENRPVRSQEDMPPETVSRTIHLQRVDVRRESEPNVLTDELVVGRGGGVASPGRAGGGTGKPRQGEEHGHGEHTGTSHGIPGVGRRGLAGPKEICSGRAVVRNCRGAATGTERNDPAGARTQDLRIKSPLLYQLSYRVSGRRRRLAPRQHPRNKIGAPRET